MPRSVLSLMSALALLLGSAGFGGSALAHEGDKQCNVLLDGDGEPVKETDDDDIAHSNSHACASDDKADDSANVSAEVPAEEAPQQVANVTPAPVVVEPLTVYFDSGSSKLTAGSEAEVAAFVEQLRTTDPKTITVVGYTDTSGSVEVNQRLSNERASNVVASLVDGGIAGTLITQTAVGEDTLAVETPDDTREPNNRRVVVTPEY